MNANTCKNPVLNTVKIITQQPFTNVSRQRIDAGETLLELTKRVLNVNSTIGQSDVINSLKWNVGMRSILTEWCQDMLVNLVCFVAEEISIFVE